RRAERLDADRGAAPDGGGAGRAVSARVRPPLAARHAGGGSCDWRRGRHRARRRELWPRTREAVHVLHPAVDAEHARPVRLLLARGVHDGALGAPADGGRCANGLRARVPVFDVGNRRRRKRRRDVRLSAAARRPAGLRLGRAHVTRQCEVGRITRVILKAPREAFESAAAIDAQWRALNFTAAPDLSRAAAEYEHFVDLLEAHEVAPTFLRDAGGLDSIYLLDASDID